MTRAELFARCLSIMDNEPWDHNAVANSATELADLLVEMTGAKIEEDAVLVDAQGKPASQTTIDTGTPPCHGAVLCGTTKKDFIE